MIKTIFYLSLFCQMAISKSVTYSERTTSESKNKVFRFFDLGGDGVFQWESSSEGDSICPEKAGVYKAQLNKKETEDFFKVSVDLIADQKKYAFKKKSLTISDLDDYQQFFLKVFDGEKLLKSELIKSSDIYKNFMSLLSNSKKKSFPLLELKMNAKIINNRIEIRFIYEGEEEYELFFFENPNRQFSLRGTRFSYLKKIPKEGIVLNKKNTQYIVYLRPEKINKNHFLYFNHFNINAKKRDRSNLNISICSKIN